MFNSVKIIRSAVVAMATVGVLLVAGCTGDLEKRISKVEDEVRTLKALTETLSSKMEANLLVKSVTAVGTGWDIVFSDDSKVEVRNEGADGITPKLKVAANGEDGYSLWYNVTAGYPESGWVNTEVNIQGPAGPGGGPGGSGGTFDMRVSGGMFQYTTDGTTWTDLVAVPKGSLAVVSVTDNRDGTVTFVTEAGTFIFPVAFEVVDRIELIAVDDSGDLQSAMDAVPAIRIRVNPSNAKLDASKLSFDDVKTDFTRATGDYRNTSEHFAVEKLEQEADGQYVVWVKAIGTVPGSYKVALVYEVSSDPLVLISTSMFEFEYAAGELSLAALQLAKIKTLAEHDGFEEEDIEIAFSSTEDWKVIVSPATAVQGDTAWITLDPDHDSANASSVFKIDLKKNEGPGERSATITVTTEEDNDADGHSEFSFIVKQEVAFEVLTEGGFDDKLADALDTFLTNMGGVLDTDGNLTKAAAAAVTTLELDNKGLTDLTGLDTFFTGLEKLDLSGNAGLEEADLSGFKKMTELVIENSGIESLTLPAPEEGEEGNLLTDLTVTDNEKLTTINLSKATELQTATLSGNGLTSITLPAEAESLLTLDVSDNKLKGIDVSNLPDLTDLEVEGNPGEEIIIPTRVDDPTHKFTVKVWKGFNVDDTGNYPGKNDTWTYDPNDTVDDDEYDVIIAYDVQATVYATTVDISTQGATLSGSHGARTLTVTTNSAPIIFIGTVNADADDKKVAFTLERNSGVASISGSTVTFTGEVGQFDLIATAAGAEPGKDPVTDKVTITVEPAVAVGTFTLAAYDGSGDGANVVDPANIYALGAVQTVYLKPTLNPAPTLTTIAWEIDDPETNSAEDLFSINPTTGVVMIKAGAEAGDTATATAKITNGKGYGKDATATITFTVVAFTAVETLTVEAYDGAGDTATKIDDADLGELVVDGQERTIHLRAVIAPDDASIQTVVWSKEEGGDDTIEIDPETGIVTIDTDATYEESATFKATIVGGGDDGEDISDEITLTMEANE